MKKSITAISALMFLLFGCTNQSVITEEIPNYSTEQQTETQDSTTIEVISAQEKKCNYKADQLFYAIYPEREGENIKEEEQEWANEWLEIRANINGCEFLAQSQTSPESDSIETVENEEEKYLELDHQNDEILEKSEPDNDADSYIPPIYSEPMPSSTSSPYSSHPTDPSSDEAHWNWEECGDWSGC